MSTRRRKCNCGGSDAEIMMLGLAIAFLPFWLLYELLKAIFE